MIRVYDEAGNVIETHEEAGEFSVILGPNGEITNVIGTGFRFRGVEILGKL
jgi:hypothetical protein